MARQSIESWRAPLDLRMELSQEIREKQRIAIGFRITGTHTGDIPGLPASGGAIDVEGTAFLTLSGGKITEVWTVFDALALAVQTGAAESARLVAGAQLNPRPVVQRGAHRAGRPSSGGRAVASAGSSLLAAAHRPQQHPCASTQQCEVGEHLDDEHDPGGLGFGGDVAEADRGEDGHAEVQGVGAGQRSWAKFTAESRSIRK